MQIKRSTHLAEDHPRVCGKNKYVFVAQALKQGSPPRMREKQKVSTVKTTCSRITPAYAGKTPTVNACMIGGRDHPRVCGKNFIMETTNKKYKGSPPRMREKLVFNISIVSLSRITPAYAGKTTIVASSLFCCQDHPRVCGKNLQCLKSLFKALGSPPRMREKRKLYAIRTT